jgi:hypothetical protein
MLSRKHYRVIASIIKDNSVEVVDETTQDGDTTSYINKDNFIDDLTTYFHSDNKSFSWEKFVNAINGV